MRTIWLFAVTAILTTGALWSLSAGAGEKNLKFGYPLGSFTASPNSGGSHSTAKKTYSKQHPSPSAKRQAAARRAAARKRAAKKAAAAERAAAKANSDTGKTVSQTSTGTEDAKLAPVKASAIAATNTLKFRPEPPPEQGSDEAGGSATETAGGPNAAYECKRYIPSAGMTVSVPCGPDPQ